MSNLLEGFLTGIGPSQDLKDSGLSNTTTGTRKKRGSCKGERKVGKLNSQLTAREMYK